MDVALGWKDRGLNQTHSTHMAASQGLVNSLVRACLGSSVPLVVVEGNQREKGGAQKKARRQFGTLWADQRANKRHVWIFMAPDTETVPSKGPTLPQLQRLWEQACPVWKNATHLKLLHLALWRTRALDGYWPSPLTMSPAREA